MRRPHGHAGRDRARFEAHTLTRVVLVVSLGICNSEHGVSERSNTSFVTP